MAFDLMERGRSIHDLGTIGLSWLELDAFIEHAPDGTAIRRLSDPVSPYRTPEGQLLAAAVDTLAGANWQRGGGKGPKPKPLMDRVKEQIDRARRDAKAPESADQMAEIRARIAAKRRASKDVDKKKITRRTAAQKTP